VQSPSLNQEELETKLTRAERKLGNLCQLCSVKFFDNSIKYIHYSGNICYKYLYAEAKRHLKEFKQNNVKQ